MSLDHYVSQVHLKNFYSPELGHLMYAIRKSDLKAFTPNAQSVCRIEEGSTNQYLLEERAIEEFLKDIEPKYNATLEKIIKNDIDAECIYVIAGFIAYVHTCSPAGMRIDAALLKPSVEETARMLGANGAIPPPPPQVGKNSLTELLDKGKLRINIDQKFPQAIGISSIHSFISTFSSFKWDILINPFGDSPFFTSDFPIAIEKTDDPQILNRVVPLSPHIAIRIRPSLSIPEKSPEYSPSIIHSIRQIPRQEVININRLIVRCAETIVFFRDNNEWVTKFVKKNAGFRIEPRTRKIHYNTGTQLFSTLEIVRI
jgi:hypothetical protein